MLKIRLEKFVSRTFQRKMSVKPISLEENKYGNNSTYKKYCDHNDDFWEYEHNVKVLIQYIMLCNESIYYCLSDLSYQN